MNDTGAAVHSSASEMLDSSTGAITLVHLGLIALFIVLVVIGILYGMRLKRRRIAADEKVEADADAAHVETPQPAASEAPADNPAEAAAAPLLKPAIAPPPPPLDDSLPGPSPLADEPIPASAPLEANPVVEADSAPDPAPAADAPATWAAQPVTLLKGLGPKVAARLAELGITEVGQIAALDEDAAARLDAELGTFKGRMARDRWIEQARFLAAGDRAGFEAVFGKL